MGCVEHKKFENVEGFVMANSLGFTCLVVVLQLQRTVITVSSKEGAALQGLREQRERE